MMATSTVVDVLAGGRVRSHHRVGIGYSLVCERRSSMRHGLRTCGRRRIDDPVVNCGLPILSVFAPDCALELDAANRTRINTARQSRVLFVIDRFLSS